MDEQPLTLAQVGAHVEVAPHRAGNLRKRCSLDDVHALRHGHDLTDRHGNLGRVSTAAEKCGDLLANAIKGNRSTHRRDRPAAFEAEDL